MIPLKIDIKNFLSYGPDIQTVNFEPYHLICLNGKNGHGKSALLDAITWAIWGQARKTTGTNKADEGLVHLGQKHMLVVLDFIVGNNTYKVRREFIKTQSKGMCTLEFGILQTDGNIKSLTDKTIKATQDVIEKAIGITFDAFINSTFLRQGQSNEFSKKSPKERKDILASILQLQDFDALKTYALNAAREIHNSIASKENIIAHILKEETELIHATQGYEQVLTYLTDKKNELQSLQSKQEKIVQLIQTYEKEKQIFVLLTEQQKELSTEQQEKTAHIKKIAAQWHELHAQTLQKQSLAQAQDHLQNIQKKLSDLHKAQEKKLQLKEIYLGLKEQEAAVLKIIETEFLEEKNKLTTHISVTQEQHKHLTQTLALKEKAYTQTLHKHHELSQKIEFVEKQKNELQKQCSIHTQEELTQKQLAVRSKQTEREHAHDLSVQLAQKQQQLDHPESCCPLCEQQLSQSRKKFLTSQCATEYEQLTQKVKLLDQEIVHAQEEIKSIHRAILQDETKKIELSTRDQELSLAQSLLEKESAQKQTLESEIAQIQTQCAQIAQTLQTLHQHAQILPTEFEQKKDANKALQAIHAEIEAVITQGKAVPYNVQEHKTVQEQYESAQKTVHALENQHALINKKEELYSILQNLYQAIQTIQTEWHKKEVQKQSCHIDKLPGVHKEYTEIESQIKSVQQNIQSLIQEQNKQDVYKQKIEKIAQEKKELQAGIELQQKEMFDYQEIAKALGKDGIQALLIEEAIPEIENEANDLLSKLTNNQTHIFIESLRDLKKGGHKETLDIKIADNYGLRPYEMFSGGEAFRIDFALRIAISKLLARRAGTNLQTLIIDEGFGSQDDEGLGLIMDCLTKIQDDFAKVIIISHLPLLKEQFPVQFLVQKQASGSVISVIEQG